MIQWVKNILRLPLDKSDLFLSLGTGFLFYGTRQIYPPAAYCLVGIICMFVSWNLANPKPLLDAKEAK